MTTALSWERVGEAGVRVNNYSSSTASGSPSPGGKAGEHLIHRNQSSSALTCHGFLWVEATTALSWERVGEAGVRVNIAHIALIHRKRSPFPRGEGL